ncbi:MAG: polysaccharide export protein [Deltaproteobacteria bacterium]|nr:polysaccharide export protein [Deltaproteobacteria bacterium]
MFVLSLLCIILIQGNALSAEESAYKIGPGDEIEISVWKDQNLSRSIIVPPDGVISFPLIGDVDTKSLTVPEVREIIAKKLSAYIKNPAISVMLTKPNSLVAYVVGKVNKPGQYSINVNTTVIQILAMAEDLNPFASPGNIIIIRKDNGEAKTIPFDYNEVKKGKNLQQNIVLKRGDVVIVP